jgi:zinc D-Ala-D-Ala carboxypeptidase
MNTTKYFTLAELLQSNTALSCKIPNLPTWQQVENLNRLVSSVLDPVRAKFGKPIKVSSGFRSPTLNAKVGGVSNSQHLQGLAADLQATDLKALKQAIITANAPFDQLIEESKGNTKWLHVSVAATGKTPRKQVLTITL